MGALYLQEVSLCLYEDPSTLREELRRQRIASLNGETAYWRHTQVQLEHQIQSQAQEVESLKKHLEDLERELPEKSATPALAERLKFKGYRRAGKAVKRATNKLQALKSALAKRVIMDEILRSAKKVQTTVQDFARLDTRGFKRRVRTECEAFANGAEVYAKFRMQEELKQKVPKRS